MTIKVNLQSFFLELKRVKKYAYQLFKSLYVGCNIFFTKTLFAFSTKTREKSHVLRYIRVKKSTNMYYVYLYFDLKS